MTTSSTSRRNPLASTVPSGNPLAGLKRYPPTPVETARGFDPTPRPLITRDAAEDGDGGAESSAAGGVFGSAGAGGGGGGGGAAGRSAAATPLRPAAVRPAAGHKPKSRGAGSAEDERDYEIALELRETSTMTLLAITGTCVALDDPKMANAATARNTAYDAVVQARATSDLFAPRHAQTFNMAQKTKEVHAAPPATRETGCDASEWDIYDSAVAAAAAAEADGAAAVEAAVSAPSPDKAAAGGSAGGDAAAAGGEKPAAAEGGGVASTRGPLGPTTELSLQVEEAVAASSAVKGCLLDVGDGNPPAASLQAVAEAAEAAAAGAAADAESGVMTTPALSTLMNGSETLLRSLMVAERAVQQNTFHAHHLQYRDFPASNAVRPSAGALEAAAAAVQSEQMADDVEKQLAAGLTLNSAAAAAADDDAAAAMGVSADALAMAAGKPALEPLWSFACPLTRGRTVAGLVWNVADPDLLAVAYGQFDFLGQRDGMVLFWSLKNPEYPERIFRMPCGVTSLDFSTAHPYLLAVGLYDGTVAIYDIREESDAPVLASAQGEGKHMDPVWQVMWVDRGSEKGEVLVSISTDGSVMEWTTNKGLAFSTLMVLKRASDPKSRKADDNDGIISRQGSGFCFDFPTAAAATAPMAAATLVNSNNEHDGIYLAGTEDGAIHKCSCSYNEQYLDSFFGHRCVRAAFGSALRLSSSLFATLRAPSSRPATDRIHSPPPPCWLLLSPPPPLQRSGVQDPLVAVPWRRLLVVLRRLEHQAVEPVAAQGQRADALLLQQRGVPGRDARRGVVAAVLDGLRLRYGGRPRGGLRPRCVDAGPRGDRHAAAHGGRGGGGRGRGRRGGRRGCRSR
jgi:murein DD-endopeptidase MepM/ murein hydrolase activator NlpD